MNTLLTDVTDEKIEKLFWKPFPEIFKSTKYLIDKEFKENVASEAGVSLSAFKKQAYGYCGASHKVVIAYLKLLNDRVKSFDHV
jgi:hypothetical protein